MYKDMEEALITGAIDLSENIRGKVIRNKPLEKRYGAVLHEMSTCIFRTSDLLRYVTKELIMKQKFLR